MVTESDLKPYLAAMRDFMRATHDLEFRNYLEEQGWISDFDIVIAFDDETIAALVSRLAYNEATSPCLVAIPHALERFGFRIFFMQAIRPRPEEGHMPTPISPQATVGMLYSSLLNCDAYVPSEWVDMMFTKVPLPQPA